MRPESTILWKGVCSFLYVLVLFHAASKQVRAGTPSPEVRIGRVLVVANSRSAASLEIAATYLRSRNLPPVNLLLLPFDDPISLPAKEFPKRLLTPVQARLRQLNPWVDYVVLCRDVPYRTGRVSTTTALMFRGIERIRPGHAWFERNGAFESCIPLDDAPSMHPGTLLSAFTVDEALRMIRDARVHVPSVAQAGRFVFCDGRGARGVRNGQTSGAVALLTRLGATCVHIPHPDLHGQTDVFFWMTGATRVHPGDNTFRPGAVLDNLTSFGGRLFEKSGQMSVLTFIEHGGSGAFGTVSEPTNRLTRWAAATLPVRYAEGRSLAEAYLQSVLDWRYGAVVGDPLMAPLAKVPVLHLPSLSAPLALDRVKQPLSFEVTSPPGAPLAWVSVWLNDQDRLLRWTPQVPAGSQWSLTVRREEKILYAKHGVTGRTETVPEFVAELCEEPHHGGVTVRACAKRRNKLLVRIAPRLLDAAGSASHLPRCVLTLTRTETEHQFEGLLRPVPVYARGIEYDFGSSPPKAGDRVTVTCGARRLVIEADGKESLADFIERLRLKMAQDLPESSNREGAWRTELRKTASSKKDTRYRLIVLERQPTAPGRGAATEAGANDRPVLSVSRTPGSKFAARLHHRGQWAPVLAALGYAAVLEPTWPVPKATFRFLPTPETACPGWNRLMFRAGAIGDGEVEAVRWFTVDSAGPIPVVHLGEPTVSLDTESCLDWAVPKALAPGCPQLFVDGAPYCSWAAGTHRAAVTWRLPLISPGRHTIWIEWARRPALPPLLASRRPLARSAPVDIFVRRPLAAGVSFSPQKAKTGPAAGVQFRGPYLRNGLRLTFNRRYARTLQRRNKLYGFLWEARVGDLPPAQYRIRIDGDPARETAGVLPHPLVVLPATELKPGKETP